MLELPDHRAVGERVDQDHPAGRPGAAAQGADHQAGQGRADDAGGVERGGVEADGVGEVVGADHLGDERLAGGRVEGRADAEEEGDHVDLPDLGHRRVTASTPSTSEASAMVSWVSWSRRRLGKRSAITPAYGERSRTGRNCRPVVMPRAVPLPSVRLQDQPVLGDALHPGAGVGHQAAERVAPVVGVVECAEGGAQEVLSVRVGESFEDRRGAPEGVALVGGELAQALGEPGVAAGAVGEDAWPGPARRARRRPGGRRSRGHGVRRSRRRSRPLTMRVMLGGWMRSCAASSPTVRSPLRNRQPSTAIGAHAQHVVGVTLAAPADGAGASRSAGARSRARHRCGRPSRRWAYR